MSRSLRYHPLFEHDLLSAAEWYDERNPILGDDFLVRVRGAIEDLTTDPKRRASIDFGIRYWPVQRFPYVVFYDLFDSEIPDSRCHAYFARAFQMACPAKVAPTTRTHRNRCGQTSGKQQLPKQLDSST
ncbi:MAG: type II toxin-antitoxin system RelE/ParE family toxin [Pirellulaceae bacterium]